MIIVNWWTFIEPNTGGKLKKAFFYSKLNQKHVRLMTTYFSEYQNKFH